MQIGMIGLGRIGASMTMRVLRGGHHCVIHDRDPKGVERLVALGATGATSLQHPATTLDWVSGGWGPAAANHFIAADGGWRNPEPELMRCRYPSKSTR